MQNERIYEALRLMYPQADPLIAWRLEQGPHTGGQIAITQWNLPAPQPTQAELDSAYAQLAKIDRQAQIQRELDAIDLQSVRPVRAKLAGTATAEDEAKIAALEAQAQTLRTELADMQKG